MKKFGFIIVFILLFLSSCGNPQVEYNFKIINMEENGDSYYLEVSSNIDLKDYIETNMAYSVNYNNKLYILNI